MCVDGDDDDDDDDDRVHDVGVDNDDDDDDDDDDDNDDNGGAYDQQLAVLCGRRHLPLMNLCKLLIEGGTMMMTMIIFTTMVI